jgi:LacI family transcriptional regulator
MRDLVHDLVYKRCVSGLILVGGVLGKRDLDMLQQGSIPVVMTETDNPRVDRVVVDNEHGGYLAGKHLVEKGRKRIAMVDCGSGPIQRMREHGFLRALREGGVAFDPALRFTAHHFGPQHGYETGKTIITSKRKIDAVFSSAGDEMAMGLIHYMLGHGVRVPDDIAVVGYDDIQSAEFFYPPLTTVRQPFYDMGFNAADRLVDIIESGTSWDYEPRRYLLETKLVVRASA